MYLIGYDIGSSSIKAALIDVHSGEDLYVHQEPGKEMNIISNDPDWAEQDPLVWWEHVCSATKAILEVTKIDPKKIQGIGIAYQMHGLVLVDKNKELIRPAIIWCDSRAVDIGAKAFDEIGHEECLEHFLNSPGNFTASKLKWVKENEPSNYNRIYKLMLPGDYIAMKLSGSISTSISGLSEGVFWDFKEKSIAHLLLDQFELDESMIPEIHDAISIQARVNDEGASQTGLIAGTPISYRAGDQPNNALALNVLEPGEVAATGGTSGVVYGVVEKPMFDIASRVNAFAHVNYTNDKTRIGILLCINGAGIQYSWMRKYMGQEFVSYEDMEHAISAIPIGSDGLIILPFGNGAERMLENVNLGAKYENVNFNRHTNLHFF
ncbi:MAG: FGGY family carbohydrate kinase, partial [Bacteroidota bacterium]